MAQPKHCFVVIGFGKKVSYANGVARTLDLDQTFFKLIKPAFDEMGIPCQRACDMNVSGSIDRVMLRAIKRSEIVICDISCLNANVMWETGVRHALNARHTILISEKVQLAAIPFDISHNVIQPYEHSETGITDEEAKRFKDLLIDLVGKLDENTNETDSPVYEILGKDLGWNPDDENEAPAESMASLMDRAEKAKKQKDWGLALELFGQAKERAKDSAVLKDSLPLIISRLALCTYQSKQPSELHALIKAQVILDELKPKQTIDIEVLGLSGAINKRLFQLEKKPEYLDESIWFYENGFRLKQDYYNGINEAFMTYKKAEMQKADGNDEWEDTKADAESIGRKVLKVALALEAEPDFEKKQDAVWILYTIAEAYNYKNDSAKMAEYEDKAKAVATATHDTFATSSYEEQKAKIAVIMAALE